MPTTGMSISASVPGSSMNGWLAGTRAVTSSPSMQATLRPFKPSSRAIVSVRSAAARGLAAPILVIMTVPALRQAGTVMITNMGAANPRAAAERTLTIARELGLQGLKVACIEGDDVTALVPANQPFMDEPGTLADIDMPVVGMNAYLGADAIL